MNHGGLTMGNRKAQRLLRVCGEGLVYLLYLLVMSLPVAGKEPSSLTLARGARVGVVNLLDAEVTHFHGAKEIKDSFLKTHPVSWSVDAMLADALKERLGQMGLVLVPLVVNEAL